MPDILTRLCLVGVAVLFAAAPWPEKYHPGWPSNDVERARLRKRVDGGYQIDANHALAEMRKQCGEATRIVMMTPSIYDSTARAPKYFVGKDPAWDEILGWFSADFGR